MANAIGEDWNIAPRADGLLYMEDLAPPPTQSSQSWDERSQEPNVEFAVRFDSSADLPDYTPPYPTIGEAVGQWGRLVNDGWSGTNCVYDPVMNCMRLNVNPSEPGQGAGEWARNFDDNLVKTWGEGSEFWVQHAFYASFPWLDWSRNTGGPPKISNISSGDTLSPAAQYSSCTAKEIVSQLVQLPRSGAVPGTHYMYSKCGSPSDIAERGAQTNPSEGPLMQPRWNGTGYDEGMRFNGGDPAALPGNIFVLIPRWTWCYINYYVKVGTFGQPNSQITCELVVPEAGGAKMTVYDLRDHILRAGDGMWGKLWLTAFSTGKVSGGGGSNDAYCYTAYREAIVSSGPIADPFIPDSEKTETQKVIDGLTAGEWGLVGDQSGGDSMNFLGTWGKNGGLSSSASNCQFFTTSMGYDFHNKKLFCQLVADPGPTAGCPVFREEENRWVLVGPSPSQSGAASGTSHGYDFAASSFDDRRRKFLYQAYAASNAVEELDLDTETWSVNSAIQAHASTNNRGSHAHCWWPGHGFLYRGAGDTTKLWRENLGSWITIRSVDGTWNLGPYAQYNPVYDCCFVGGGEGSLNGIMYRVEWDRQGYSAGNYTHKQIATFPGSQLSSNSTQQPMIQDPASGDMIVVDGDFTMYAYNPSTDQWSNLGNVGSRFPGSIGASVVGAIQNYGGAIVFLNSDQFSEVWQQWIYKHADPSPFAFKQLASI